MDALSLHINQQNWAISLLNEEAIILAPVEQHKVLEQVHHLYRMIEDSNIELITDIVPAYDSITVFWDASRTTKKELINTLAGLKPKEKDLNRNPKIFQIKVDYSTGLDWDRVEKHTGLNRREIIKRHASTTYKVAMIGFLPGFIFLEGLDPALSVPRLHSPRNKIPEGSIGIGGSQTGMYALPSAGGWNIIGTSKEKFFDSTQHPPIKIKPGDRVKFLEVG